VEGKSFTGREASMSTLGELRDTWEESASSIDEFRDLGDSVLAVGSLEGRGRGSESRSCCRSARSATTAKAGSGAAVPFPITARHCGLRASPSSGQAPVSGVRPRSVRARSRSQ